MRETLSEWMTRAEVAAQTKFSAKTLRNWSAMRPPRGPRAYLVAGKARYLRSDVESWQAARLAEVPARKAA